MTLRARSITATFGQGLVVIALFAGALIVSLGCPKSDPDPGGKTTAANSKLQADSKPKANPEVVVPAREDSKVKEAAKDLAKPQAKSDPKTLSEIDPAHRQKAPSDVLFDGWRKAKLALVISGMQQGYIEPCGCTGLENQKGGLMRRHTLIKQAQEKLDCETVGLDAGQLVRRYGRQQELKYQRSVDALRAMGYQAIGFGPADLKLTAAEVMSAVVADEKTPRFVAANVGLIEFDENIVPSFRVIEAGGLKIGVTAVLGDSHHTSLSNSGDIKLKPAAEALKAVSAKLQEAKCDLHVLLANASMEETRGYAKDFPLFDIVVTTGGAQEPPWTAERLDGKKRLLIEVGRKGLYTSIVGIYDSKDDERLRYQLVPLDKRFADSPEIVAIFKQYQEQLKDNWEAGFAQYGLSVQPDPGGRQFVGTEACADCHSKAYEVWKKTPHSHATESLVHPPERSDIPRQFDAECVSCHATGWEPQEFLPFRSGFVDVKKTSHLTGSGCENCHGPGKNHVDAENDAKADDALRKRLRDEMRLPLAKAEQRCIQCHDGDNSPDFHKPGAFEKYWKKVEHPGKD